LDFLLQTVRGEEVSVFVPQFFSKSI